MGRGDSSWQDRRHSSSNPRGNNKTSTGRTPHGKKNEEVTETTPSVGTSIGTEGYDYTKATTAIKPPSSPQAGESIMNSGGTGANETYDFFKGSKAVSTTTRSTTSKKRKNNLKVNLSGAGGTGRNIV
jgi:hypothetical protein